MPRPPAAELNAMPKKSALPFGVFLAWLAWPPAAVPETGGAPKIPDFAGGWDRMGTLVETYEAIPNYGGAGILNVRGAFELLQTPTQVTIIHPTDQQVRRIYLDVPHSANPGHTWYGESIGHYEGEDTLMVDTIGLNDKTQTDRFGTPHSDQMHVVERYRVASDHRTIEVQFTVDDPGAFTMPWSARVRFRARPPVFEEQVCAENNRFVGLVFDGGRPTTTVYTPTAAKPDF
jgi:hypothetical protein